MRTAWPFSSVHWLTSEMIDPPLLRIGSISSGFVASNTSHTVSARRNKAAGVAVAKENISRSPSLSRLAFTNAPPSAAFAAGCGSETVDIIFGGAGAAGAGLCFAGAAISFGGAAGAAASFAGASFAGASFDGGEVTGVSGAGCIFAAASGLISILACLAIISDVGAAISLAGRKAGAASTGFSGAAGAVAAGAAAACIAGAAAADAGAADAGACEASAVGGSADGFSDCWKATSTM